MYYDSSPSKHALDEGDLWVYIRSLHHYNSRAVGADGTAMASAIQRPYEVLYLNQRKLLALASSNMYSYREGFTRISPDNRIPLSSCQKCQGSVHVIREGRRQGGGEEDNVTQCSFELVRDCEDVANAVVLVGCDTSQTLVVGDRITKGGCHCWWRSFHPSVNY